MNEKHCFLVKKKLFCFPGNDGGSAFKSSRDFFVKKIEKMDDDKPFRLVKNCKAQGMECFRRNIQNAGIFIFMLLLAGIVLNFLHEMVHLSFLFMIGRYDAMITFAANIGFTTGPDIPAFDDPTVPWYWWYLEMMGPLLFVNFTFVILAISLVKQDMKNPPFLDKKMGLGFKRTSITFLKAIAYTSSFTILTNTIFSPFYNMFYGLIGASNKKSDYTIAWEASLYMPEPFGTFMRLMLIVTVATIIIVPLLYIFMYDRRETGE